ncbi:MAG: TIGR04282 family arsenosugar biosynthesis glycosyltransferase [Nevskiales bacterium]
MRPEHSETTGLLYPQARIIVFAKPPIAGHCKTRLGKTLGYSRAAAVHQQLSQQVLDNLQRAAVAPFEIHSASHPNHPWFHSMRRRYHCPLRRQHGADLGQRMLYAARRALQSAPACLIIGTDCAVLQAEHLGKALKELEQGQDAVFLPSEDGGYAMLGLRKHSPLLFRNIAWGSNQVMHQTRRRLQRSGSRWSELAAVWDIDEASDYYRARRLNLI